MVGVAPVRLHQASLGGVEFADIASDPCHGVATILEQSGDDLAAYSVPVRNVECRQ